MIPTIHDMKSTDWRLDFSPAINEASGSLSQRFNPFYWLFVDLIGIEDLLTDGVVLDRSIKARTVARMTRSALLVG